MLLLWGLDENGKKLKKGLLAAGMDRAAAKAGLLLYKKIRKNAVPTVAHYHRVKELSTSILAKSRELEQLLIKEEAPSSEEIRRIKSILADFSKAEPQLDFEFVISRADKDIHLTLEGLEKLGTSWLEGKTDKLILQSEIENLIALVKEALDKEKPDLSKLTVFYIGHTDRELEEISYSSKLMLVDEIYEREYLMPLLAGVQKAIDEGTLQTNEKDAENYLKAIIQI